MSKRRARRWLVPALYIVFLLLPIYWLVSMSFKTTNEILGGFTLWPSRFTLENYGKIFTDPTWYNGYINSLIYVVDQHRDLGRGGAAGGLRLLALPLPRRQAPVLLAVDQPHGAGGGVRAAVLPALFGHRACSTRTSPWRWRTACSTSRWRSGFWRASCRACRRQLDETAYLDGYGFWRFFLRIFLPTIAAGIGVAAFFCFMFSWVELLLAKTLTSVAAKPIAATMTRTVEHLGLRAGPARRGRHADHHSGRDRHLFRAQLHRQGLRARARVGGDCRWESIDDGASVMDGWTWETAAFFVAIALMLAAMTVWELRSPAARRGAASSPSRPPAATGCSSRCSAAPSSTSAGWPCLGTPLWGALAVSLRLRARRLPLGLGVVALHEHCRHTTPPSRVWRRHGEPHGRAREGRGA